MSDAATLQPSALRDLVAEIAADVDRWRPLVHHDPKQRHFALLHRDADHEVWVLSWMSGHDTGFHDHDASGGAIRVVDGEVQEQRLAVGRDNVDRRFAVGETIVVRPSDIHRVRHAGDVPSVTIHAYSPPLTRMGQYEIGANGILHRHASDADEELRLVAA